MPLAGAPLPALGGIRSCPSVVWPCVSYPCSDNPSKRYLEEHLSKSGGLVRTVHVWCSVMSLDGTIEKHATHSDTIDGSDADGCGPEQALVRARQLGEELGAMLLKKGADKLLEGIVDKEGPGHRAPSSAAAAASSSSSH